MENQVYSQRALKILLKIHATTKVKLYYLGPIKVLWGYEILKFTLPISLFEWSLAGIFLTLLWKIWQRPSQHWPFSKPHRFVSFTTLHLLLFGISCLGQSCSSLGCIFVILNNCMLALYVPLLQLERCQTGCSIFM